MVAWCMVVVGVMVWMTVVVVMVSVVVVVVQVMVDRLKCTTETIVVVFIWYALVITYVTGNVSSHFQGRWRGGATERGGTGR